MEEKDPITVEFIKQVVEAAGDRFKGVKKVVLDGGNRNAEDRCSSLTLRSAEVEFDDDRENLKLFLKICRAGTQDERNNELLWTYEKEELMYNKIIPKLNEFAGDVTSVDTPLHFFSGPLGKDRLIVLKNLSEQGYGPAKRAGMHDEYQVKCTLLSLARFQALSYAYSQKNNFDFLKEYPKLEDTFLRDEAKEVVIPLINGVFSLITHQLSVLAGAYDTSEVVQKHFKKEDFPTKEDFEILNRGGKSMFYVCREKLACDKKAILVGHGDFHMYNIWYKAQKEGSKDLVCKWFDLQLSRTSSGLLDFHQYYVQCTTPSFRAEHNDTMIAAYQQEFERVCKALGCEGEDFWYTKENVEKEYLDKYMWGFMYNYNFTMWKFIAPPVLTTMKGSLEAIVKGLDESEEGKGWYGMKIICDLVKEAKALGKLDELKTVAIPDQ